MPSARIGARAVWTYERHARTANLKAAAKGELTVLAAQNVVLVGEKARSARVTRRVAARAERPWLVP